MQRILVKAAPGLSQSSMTFGVAGAPLQIEPLFTSIGPPGGIGVAANDLWYVVTPPPAMAGQNAWDVCHSLLQGLGINGTPAPKFAEPDIEQRWMTSSAAQAGQALAQSCDTRDPQNPDYPRNANDYWFRDSAHSQFDAAIAAIGGPDVASQVRIAHFDTGYDPNHHSLPKRLRRDGIQRNFVDGDRPNDASDRTTGLFTNLGHGTGTLGILAGTGIPQQTLLGGAPFAEIVPIRVANRVVLFSNSSIAKAFDYVHKLNADG